MQTIQYLSNKIHFLFQQFGFRTNLCFTDQETQDTGDFTGRDQLHRGPVLTPIHLLCKAQDSMAVHTAQMLAIWINITSLCIKDSIYKFPKSLPRNWRVWWNWPCHYSCIPWWTKIKNLWVEFHGTYHIISVPYWTFFNICTGFMKKIGPLILIKILI